MRRHAWRLAIGAAAVLALWPYAVARADAVLGSSALPSKVSAFGGLVAWDSASYTSDGLRHVRGITVSADGVTALLPVADGVQYVDLGPGPDGSPVAVYSRCQYVTQVAVGAPHYVLYTRRSMALPEGCRIFLYDFARHVEQRVAGVSAPGASEYMPTIWRDRIAFVRVYASRPGKRGVVPYIYVRRLMPGARTQRIPGGPRGVYAIAGGIHGLFGGMGPIGLDLRGDRLAWTWEWEPDMQHAITEVRVARIGGRPRVLERATTSGLTSYAHGNIADARVDALVAPVLTSSSIFYARWSTTKPSRWVVRSLKTGRRRTAPAPVSGWRPTTIATSTGQTFYYTTVDGRLGTCSSVSSGHGEDSVFSPEGNSDCFVHQTSVTGFR